MKLLRGLSTLYLASQAAALTLGGRSFVVERDSDALQDIVTWDEHSLSVYGQPLYLFSGEFHPFRLPVPDLWLDVFLKIKALGFNAVSFYVHWALVEGKPGEYSAEGIFAFEPFFAAAQKAGIYLLARPGPYINAEVSGGGFPGWLQRVPGQLRTRAPDFLAATDNYMANIAATIAKAQITNGGPVILVQPENEYTGSSGNVTGGFPDPVYFAYVKKQLRDAGIIVPLINNDARPAGYFAPGFVVQNSTEGNVDIYAHDAYPLGFDCANPSTWPSGALPTNYHTNHVSQSPSTPFSIMEFQGGSFDPWGGLGFDQCSDLVNYEFERVFYKNNIASGATILNIYMIFGGTNWGNLGHPGGYTSYDYGSVITENREIDREKYSELKLQGNFLKVSPAILTASVGEATGNLTNNPSITVTPLLGNGSATNFYIVRHSDFRSQTAVNYNASFTTSKGDYTIPQLEGSLTLSGRDSKYHVTDYDLGGINLLYCSAEIFTWKKFADKTVLIVFSGPEEQHELAIETPESAVVVEGAALASQSADGVTILNWLTSTSRRVVQVGGLFVYLLDRNTAYNYWVPDFVRTDIWGAYTSNIGNLTSVIVQAGYLVRSVNIQDSGLYIYGDANATTPIKVIGAPSSTDSLYFNGQKLDFITNVDTGDWSSTLEYTAPTINLPDLSTLSWKYVDSLPELTNGYSDAAWTVASNPTSNNSLVPLRTPTSLFSSDYGYHAGVLIYRGSFVATGSEAEFSVTTQGGSAFGSSTWLDATYLGSWPGIDKFGNYNSTYTLPNLIAGNTYTFTIVIDNNGVDQNWIVGPDLAKNPRGVLNYALPGHPQSDISWKLTGNLGGEDYVDKVRGPLNEGGLWAERQGFHQPSPPSEAWATGSPFTGVGRAGVSFYQTSFDLNLPLNYDIPLSFNFANTTINGTTANFRAQLYVNGYQFAKYVNNIGPQTIFPVPQGILNYQGQNWLAIELWAQQESGAYLGGLTLEPGIVAWTSLATPALVPAPPYSERPNAY